MSGGDSVDSAVEAQRFSTIAAMLLSTIAPAFAGRPWRAAGYDYVEAPAGVADYHLATAAGVLLYVRPVGGAFPAEAFGAIADGVTDCGAILVRAAQIGLRLRFGVGTFWIGNAALPASSGSVFLGEGQATRILFSGDQAIKCRPAEGLTGPAMFSTFAQGVVVRGINFVRTAFSTAASAIFMANVRGLWVDGCHYSGSRLLMVSHEAQESGAYNTASGSTTVDPAVVAGFSAADITDLNEHIFVRDNVSWNTQFGAQGVRINWARYGQISGNSFPYGNISWWGGGATPTTGGQPGMLRRFAHFRIYGNYCSWNNGGIYGNNGECIVAANNTLEYSLDTALDFEGCINCEGIGNTIRHFGNYATSTFYLARNVSFRSNTIECTMQGASISALLGVTTYMQSVSITGIADSGDGGTNVTVSIGADLVSGQTVLIQTAPGGPRQPVTITRVSSTVYRANVAYQAGWAAGGAMAFQRGRTYFCATAGLGVDATGVVKGEVVFEENTVGAYDGLLGSTQDTQAETVIVRNNKLTNCRVSLTYGTGDQKVVTENVMKFRHAVGSYATGYVAAVPEADSYMLIDVDGYTKATVSRNIIALLSNGVWVPAGTAAINVTTSRQSNGQISVDIEGNKLTRVQTGNVTDGLNHSSSNVLSIGASASISDNLLPSIVDSSPAGACRSAFSGNRVTGTGGSLDLLALAPANGATLAMAANHRQVYLTHGATIGSMVLTLPVDPADEAVFRVTARSAVTTLTVTNGSTGAPTVIGSIPGALAAGQTVQVRFSRSLNAWIWG